MAARVEIEALLGMKVFLELHVTVQPGWRDNPAMVRQIDWRTQLSQLSEMSDNLDELNRESGEVPGRELAPENVEIFEEDEDDAGDEEDDDDEGESVVK
jgi:hypothetical protein